jgi:hypothetical protein
MHRSLSALALPLLALLLRTGPADAQSKPLGESDLDEPPREGFYQPSSEYPENVVGPRTHLLFSLPLLLGGASDADLGFYYGLRPELVLARFSTRSARAVGRGFGCGLYGELLRLSGDSVLGAGVTCVAYLGGYAVAPSVGVASRPAGDERDGAVAAGLFFGFRGWDSEIGSTDDPVGIRIDGHFGYGDGDGKDRVIMVSVAFDLTIVPQVLSAFGDLASP